MPVIEAGCYARCQGKGCATGICQQTDINPCICEEGMDCCAACGMHEWLCLAPPETCTSPAGGPQIVSAGKSFGMCIGDCNYDLLFATDDAAGCMTVSLTVCEQFFAICATPNQGTLTPAGQAKAMGLAAELSGVALEEVYGCPDCADGGAAKVVLQFGGEISEITYEYANPPDLLASVDAFTQGLIDALTNCVSSEDVVIPTSDCLPR
jgi:hypothetical protein